MKKKLFSMIKELKSVDKGITRADSLNSVFEKILPSNYVNPTAFFYEHVLRLYSLLKLNYTNVMQIFKIDRVLIFVTGVPLNDIRKTGLGLEILTGQKTFCSILSTSQNGMKSGKIKKRTKTSSLLKLQQSDTLQKSFSTRTRRSISLKPTLYNSKGSFRRSNFESDSMIIYCSLRNKAMYHFLEKLVCFRLLTPIAPSYSFPSSQTSDEQLLLRIRSQAPKLTNVVIQGVDTIQMKLEGRQIRLFPEIQNHFEFFETIQSIDIKIITSARLKEETWLLWTSLQQKDI